MTHSQEQMAEAVENHIFKNIDVEDLLLDLENMFDLYVLSDGFVPSSITTYRTLERFLKDLKKIEETRELAVV